MGNHVIIMKKNYFKLFQPTTEMHGKDVVEHGQ
jgi:hypothetical protein